MVFLLIIDVWTATSLSTLKSTKGLYSWCCVWVEEEGIQMIKQVIGKSLDDVLRHWLDLPTHHGGIHDIDMWYSGVNARMHCIDVAMSIGTLVYW
jgi:hypothetical protein